MYLGSWMNILAQCRFSSEGSESLCLHALIPFSSLIYQICSGTSWISAKAHWQFTFALSFSHRVHNLVAHSFCMSKSCLDSWTFVYSYNRELKPTFTIIQANKQSNVCIYIHNKSCKPVASYAVLKVGQKILHI